MERTQPSTSLPSSPLPEDTASALCQAKMASEENQPLPAPAENTLVCPATPTNQPGRCPNPGNNETESWETFTETSTSTMTESVTENPENVTDSSVSFKKISASSLTESVTENVADFSESFTETSASSLTESVSEALTSLTLQDAESSLSRCDEAQSEPSLPADEPQLPHRECEERHCEGLPGIRMRRAHLGVSSARTVGSLHCVSHPEEVLIRALGPNNRFLLVRGDNKPSVSTLSLEELYQAVFQKQEFFHDRQGKVVTTFCHMSSNSYLAVCPETHEVILVGDDASDGVVSLNGPSRPDRPPWVDGDDTPCPCSLFIVLDHGHARIQPAMCPNTSLDVSPSGDGLQVVEGSKWNFKLMPADSLVGDKVLGDRVVEGSMKPMPADQAGEALSEKDLRKLMKKSLLCVLFTSRPA